MDIKDIDIEKAAKEISKKIIATQRKSEKFFESKKFLSVKKKLLKFLKKENYITDNVYEDPLFLDVTNSEFIKLCNSVFAMRDHYIDNEIG
jgi:outer membrane protein assembly factor BamA